MSRGVAEVIADSTPICMWWKGTGWLSAVFVSALWGLWHLPGQGAVTIWASLGFHHPDPSAMSW